jgi:hypothetical protein
VRVRNYRSALDEETAVTRELQRHINKYYLRRNLIRHLRGVRLVARQGA